MKKLFYIIILSCIQVTIVRAAINNETPIHHQFNASLLQPGEKQISVAGNFRYGLTEHFEFGSQGTLLASGMLNLSMKHRMFTQPKFRTSFSSHSYFFKNNDPELYSLISFHGVMTDYDILPGTTIIGGLYDLFAWVKGDDNLSGEFHNITPMIGADKVLSPSWGMTLLIFMPLWGSLELVSNYADLAAEFEYYKGAKSEEGYPGLIFFSMTRSFRAVNLEFGAIYFNPAKNVFPYVNLFWRWI